MNKLFPSLCLVAVIFSSLVLAGAIPYGLAQNGTNVGGLLSVNTSWTRSNSPFYLGSPVIVGSGTTLTVEAGVTIELNSYNLQVNGILYARGTNDSNIVFVSSGDGNIVFTASSQSWNEQTDQGCIIENSILHSVSISTSSTSPKISNCTITPSYNAVDGNAITITSGSPIILGNSLSGDIETINDASPTIINNNIIGGILGSGLLTSTPVIENNTIKQGLTLIYYQGTGILASGSNNYLAGNTIFGCKTGINVYDGTTTIEKNLIIGNYIGIALTGPMSPVSATIQHNTIINNTVGLNTLGKLGPVSITNNNIVNNSQYCLSVNMASNWWGTTDQQIIAQIISNQVNFVPFLTTPDPTAPTVPNAFSFPTPFPTASPTPTPTPFPAPTISPTPNPTPTPTPKASPTPNSSSTPNPTPTQTLTPTLTPTSTSPPKTSQPVIYSVSTIQAVNLQTIRIHGSGFGTIQPQLLHLDDGSVDTVGGGTTPVIRIYDEGGSSSWEAGVQDNPNSGADSIGIILVSWSDTDIILGGFGTALSTNNTGLWTLTPGDPLLIAVLTVQGQAVYTAVVGSDSQNLPGSTGAPPAISSVSHIVASQLQNIVILGSGFGNIQPQLMNLSDGSVDTVIGGTTPVIRIYDEAGWNSWEAGCTDSQWVPKDTIGIYLTSWSENEIVLGGFGTELSVNGSGPTNISPGDPLIIDVVTSKGQAAYTTTVGSNQSNPNPSTPVLTVSCQSSPTLSNFKVEINGSLIADGQGVPFASIQLSYSVNGGNSWIDLTLVNTDNSGDFFAVWIPTVTGNYLLKAEWSGNDQYLQTSTIVNFAVTPIEKEMVFSVISNSTLSEISFNSTNKELSFTVSGPSGTTGYVNVYVSKSAINDVSGLTVQIDGKQIAYTTESAGDCWLISFSYHHSIHQVTMNLSSTQPALIGQILEGLLIGVAIAAIAIVTISLTLRKTKSAHAMRITPQ